MSSSKLKKTTTIAIAIVVVGLLLGIIIWFATGSTRMLSSQGTHVEEAEASSNSNPSKQSKSYFDFGIRPQTSAAQIKAVMERRPDIRMDQGKLEQSLNKTELTQLADPQKVFQVLPWLTEQQRTDGRKFVSYDPYVIESKFVGDRVDILIPEANMIGQGIVDSVEKLDNDIVRWQGHFDNFNDTQNRFTITQTLGDHYAVGQYETPFGSFSMESKDGYGWVVNQKTDFHLPEGGKDYVEPPHDPSR